MMAYSATLEMRPTLYSHDYRGASVEAAQLRNLMTELCAHAARSTLEFLIPDIESLLSETRDHGADPESIHVTRETVRRAVAFAWSLPRSLPTPEVSADPDGEISFDWLGASGTMFSVSINDRGRLAFAGRFSEKSKLHGTEEFVDACPSEVLRGIEKVASQRRR